MKIADRTPFRNEAGQIDFFGRVQSSLKFGMSWYERVQAQDAVIAILDKILDPNYILLRNITLPDTDIDLPLVLIGPPGVYLINVTHERGVYRARDDEWGTISGEKFAAASINQIQRTVKLGRVLQIYLDRAGYKGVVIVDPILMAADPGMHIESVRPAVRIVMSDALERFAISMNQTRPVFTAAKITDLAQILLKGPKKETAAADSDTTTGKDTTDELFSSTQQSDSSKSASADDSMAQFQTSADRRSGSTQQDNDGDAQEDSLQSLSDPVRESELLRDVEHTQTGTNSKPTSSTPKRTGPFGMTRTQLLILGGILLVWLCAMAGFAIYVYLNL